jgi:hypothetical protein
MAKLKDYKGQVINPAFLEKGGKVKTFDELVDRFGSFITMNATQLRAGINRHISPSLEAYDSYIENLKEIDSHLYTITTDWMLVNRAALNNYNWNQVVESMKGLTAQDNLDLDHTEYSIVSFRLRVIYQGLLVMQSSPAFKNAYTRVKVADVRVPDSGRPGSLENRQEAAIQVETPTFTTGQLKTLIENIRRLYIAAIALRDLKVDDARSLNQLVEDFIDSTSGPEWQLIKDNQVDVFNNKGQIGAKLTTADFNRKQKGAIETLLGGSAFNLLTKRNAAITKQFSKVNWTKLSGSEAVEDSIVRQVSEIAKGKRPRTSKSKTVRRGKTKAKATSAKIINTAVLKKGIKGTFKGRVKRPRDAESSRGFDDIFRVEQLINKRLPAEVRRNMGRPALRNQTSQFSNSVQLENLRPTVKGLSAEYTYQLSPYETFENTGIRRWPLGYNPKPLITKSIRNLAMQYTEQKLVSLRRT